MEKISVTFVQMVFSANKPWKGMETDTVQIDWLISN